MKFKCNHCDSDKYRLSMYEKLYHESKPRKTVPNLIDFKVFANNSCSISLVATCAKCEVSWSAYDSMDILQKVMIEARVLV